MLSVLIFTFLLTTTLCCPNWPDQTTNSINNRERINYRLPRHIKPIRYNLTLEPTLEPNLNPAPIFGSVTIELLVLENSRNITLHTRELRINESAISLVRSDGKIGRFLKSSRDESREFYILHFATRLVAGEEYTLTFGQYNGTLNTASGGFYVARYFDNDGVERRFATTQFQSTNARRAFPCLDEPAMKASFIVNLVRSGNFTSISNEALLYSRNLGNGRIQDTYKETVKMSTYLPAFVVSEYHYIQSGDQRVFADKHAISEGQGNFALETGIEMLLKLEEFTGIEYAMSKIDQIAIPEKHFDSGAMENWGLVTYKTHYLVYPYKKATTSERQKTVQTIAHEYAHQWFGNLVTCSWWKYIWLNEGFANYFESYAASLVKPKWRLMDQFVIISLQSSFHNDALNITEAMNYETPWAGNGPPTWVAYQKAASIIRMFEHFLTHDIFKKALNLYLNTNAFGVVEPNDLYEALQEVTTREGRDYLLGNLSVAAILESWDSQAGFPVVKVTRDYAKHEIILEQNRFYLEDAPTEDESVWFVPINFHLLNLDNSKTTASFWLTKRREEIPSPTLASDWIIVNKQQTGYYRVNYDDTNWRRLGDFLIEDDFQKIHLINRAQLLDDSFNLARTGQLHYDVPLNLSMYLRREIDYIPLTSFLTAVSFLDTMLATTQEYKIFQGYVNRLLDTAYNYLGFEEKPEDEHLDKLNRVSVLKWLCNMGNLDCRKKSLEKLRQGVTPDLEAPVFCGAMKVGNAEDWDYLYAQYERAGNNSRRARIINGLGCSGDKTILIGYLERIINPESSFRAEDRMAGFKSVWGAGNLGLDTTFDFIYENVPKMNETLNILSILEEISKKLTTHDQLAKIEELGKIHHIAHEKLEPTLKTVKKNLKWCKTYRRSILDWLVNVGEKMYLIKEESAITAVFGAGSFGFDFAFKYVSKHFFRLYIQIKHDHMKSLINNMANRITNEEQLKELTHLSEVYAMDGLFTTALENAQKNVNWNAKQVPEIKKWFTKSGVGKMYPSLLIIMMSVGIRYIFN